jgi:hypothetical protein
MNSQRPVSDRPPRRSRGDDSPAVLERLMRDLEAARVAIGRGRVASIAHTARGLMSSLGCVRVRVELSYASSAFAEGLELRDEAERWVFLAVAARATLEEAVMHGAVDLASALVEMDASFEDAADGVLLLEPEDYKEALAGTPPKGRAWWGARARLDAGVREIDLERALGLVG